MHLGRIGLRLIKSSSEEAVPSDIHETHQTLDLWSGVLSSNFRFEGLPVSVRTAVHPRLDLHLHRLIDHDEYFVAINWNRKCTLTQEDRHTFLLQPETRDSDRFELSVAFSSGERPQRSKDIGPLSGDRLSVGGVYGLFCLL